MVPHILWIVIMNADCINIIVNICHRCSRLLAKFGFILKIVACGVLAIKFAKNIEKKPNATKIKINWSQRCVNRHYYCQIIIQQIIYVTNKNERIYWLFHLSINIVCFRCVGNDRWIISICIRTVKRSLGLFATCDVSYMLSFLD